MQITISRPLATLLIAAGLYAGTGCVYHMPILQGNHLVVDARRHEQQALMHEP